jgi:hypothetical protein
MSKHQKTLEKLKSNSPASDIKWSELKSFLEYLGYLTLKSRGGSGRKFYHKEKRALFLCHQPHPSPCVDKGCIADVAEHLKEHGFLEERK